MGEIEECTNVTIDILFNSKQITKQMHVHIITARSRDRQDRIRKFKVIKSVRIVKGDEDETTAEEATVEIDDG